MADQTQDLLKAPLPAQVLSGGAVRLPLIRVRSKLVNDNTIYYRIRSDGQEAPVIDCPEIGADEDTPTNEYEIYHVAFRLEHRAIAAIEAEYGSAEKWQEALQQQTETTIIRTIALGLDRPFEEITISLLEGYSQRYGALIQAAWMRASGLDPTQARRFLKQLDEMLKEQNAIVAAEMDKAFIEMTNQLSPGKNGSKSGALSNVPSTNSGK